MPGGARGLSVAPGRWAWNVGRLAPEWRPRARGAVCMWWASEGGGRPRSLVPNGGTTISSEFGGSWGGNARGMAVAIDRTANDHVQFEGSRLDFPRADGTSSYTFLVVCKIDSQNDWGAIVFHSAEGGANGYSFGREAGTSVLSIRHSNSAESITGLYDAIIGSGKVHAIAIAYDNVEQVLECSLDGAAFYTSGFTAAPPASADEYLRPGNKTGSGSTGTFNAFAEWDHAKPMAELQALTRDPFGLFHPWRPIEVATGGTTHQLAGSLATSFALGAGLEVRRAVAGTLPLTLAPSAHVDVRRALAGSEMLVLAPAGGVDVRRALGATLPLTLQLSGALEGTLSLLGDLAVSDAALGGLGASDVALGGIALSHAKQGHLEVSAG